VASAGPYASLHLAPDRQPRQHPTTGFFTGRMPFLPPNQQRQSTEGTKVISLTAETNSVRVVQEWNKLSQDVVDAMSVNQLKDRWDKFWQRYGH